MDPDGNKKHNWIKESRMDEISLDVRYHNASYQKRFTNSLVQIWAHGLRDFSMLLTYGNEKETLENFVKEMTDTLGSIRNVAKEENRKKMSDVIHHARSSWMMVQSDESLNYLFDLIEDSTSSDDVINQAVEDVFAHGEEIIKAAQKKIEEVTA